MKLSNEIIFTSNDLERWSEMPSDKEIRKARLRRDNGIAQGLYVGASIMKQAVVDYNTLMAKFSL